MINHPFIVACEQALLFGRAKRAASRVSSRVPLARVLFTISPKWRACSQATYCPGGPVVRTPISANPGLNFFSFFFFFCLNAFSRIIFTKLQTKGIKLNSLLKLLYLNSNFVLTLGYLNPALNNRAGPLRALILYCAVSPHSPQ